MMAFKGEGKGSYVPRVMTPLDVTHRDKPLGKDEELADWMVVECHVQRKLEAVILLTLREINSCSCVGPIVMKIICCYVLDFITVIFFSVIFESG